MRVRVPLVLGVSACLLSTVLPAHARQAAFSLDVVLRRAEERSPDVAAARARVDATTIARRVVPALPDPSIELRAENLGSTPSIQLPRDVFATLSQSIELGGKRGARMADADARVLVAEQALAVVQWRLTEEVVLAYLDALRARDTVAAFRTQEERAQAIVAILDARVREGATPEADLRRFQTELVRLSAQLTRARLALDRALIELGSLSGEPITASSLTMPAGLDRLPPSMAGADALARRPDVRLAQAEVAVAEAAARQARAAAVPDVTMTAGYKRTNGIHAAVLGVHVPIGLFDRNRVAAALTAGDVRVAEQAVVSARRLAEADVAQRLRDAELLHAQVMRMAEDLLAPATVARDAARAAFAEGRGDLLPLMDAERAFGEVTREAIDLRLETVAAIARARLAYGLVRFE